ncbi:MAG: hypothetical protein AB7G87_01255 [Clostridia bacterium]
MKKQLIGLGLIFALGIIAMILPYFISLREEYSNEKQISVQNHELSNISSKENMIEPIIDLDEVQSELYDPEQMYFKNADKLYGVFDLVRVEQVKLKVQSYIHDYIDPKILDVEINAESIKNEGETISFGVIVPGVKMLNVHVFLNDERGINKIEIRHNL